MRAAARGKIKPPALHERADVKVDALLQRDPGDVDVLGDRHVGCRAGGEGACVRAAEGRLWEEEEDVAVVRRAALWVWGDVRRVLVGPGDARPVCCAEGDVGSVGVRACVSCLVVVGGRGCIVTLASGGMW